jgi:importin subunit beta-1
LCSDLSEAFPQGQYSSFFRQDWLTTMAKEVRANRDFSERTTATARWARDQIKRQIGMNMMQTGSNLPGSTLDSYSEQVTARV